MSEVTPVTQTPTASTVSALAGVSLLLTIVMGAVGMLTQWVSLMPAGVFAWVAGILLWPTVARQSKIQVTVLLGVGFSLIGWVVARGGAIPWQLLIKGNAGLIAMLAAVSFLQLAGASSATETQVYPRGRRALWQTLLGVHFVGAVINLSTVFIMARALALKGHLEHRHYISLSRLFGAAAFWSPFFASMAAALIYAPGAKLTSLILFGLPLAAISLLLTVHDVSAVGVKDFRGYPVSVSSLWMPGFLAIFILSVHAIDSNISILGLIAALVPAVCVAVIFLRGFKGNKETETPTPLRTLHRHITINLPKMSPELSLFLGAGVMAAGIATVVTEFELGFPVSNFGGLEAALLLTTLVLASMVGVHPIIGVAAASPIILPIGPDPSLLASTFLAAWGIGVAASPLSGMNLALQGSFSMRMSDILRWNGRYAVLMVLAAGFLLQLHPAA